MPTTGGNHIVITGSSFGPVGASTFSNDAGSDTYVKYGPVTGLEFSAQNCTVTVTQSKIECVTAPGVGNALLWRVSISGRVSEPLTVQDSGYTVPHITDVSHSLLPTSGKPNVGEMLIINGTNFGEASEQFEPSIMLSGDYGTPNGVNCMVTIAHTQIQCVSIEPAVGTSFKWRVMIGYQVSGFYENAMLDFKPPSVTAIRGPGASDCPTTGGLRVIIMGDNFGPSGTNSEFVSVSYALPARAPFVGESCEVISFTEIQCLMPPGTGENHVWEVLLAGQRSNALQSNTGYGAPVGKLLILGVYYEVSVSIV